MKLTQIKINLYHQKFPLLPDFQELINPDSHDKKDRLYYQSFPELSSHAKLVTLSIEKTTNAVIA
ncbi:MAG: hypothetical protein WBA93_15565 [Microcoleaceae cyanobacterium]